MSLLGFCYIKARVFLMSLNQLTRHDFIWKPTCLTKCNKSLFFFLGLRFPWWCSKQMTNCFLWQRNSKQQTIHLSHILAEVNGGPIWLPAYDFLTSALSKRTNRAQADSRLILDWQLQHSAELCFIHFSSASLVLSIVNNNNNNKSNLYSAIRH